MIMQVFKIILVLFLLVTLLHCEQTEEINENTTQENSKQEEQENINEEESNIELVGEEVENNNNVDTKLDCLQTIEKEGVTELSKFCRDSPALESSTTNPLSEEIDVQPPISQAPEKQQESETFDKVQPMSKRHFTIFPSTQNVPIIRNQFEKEVIYHLTAPRHETVSALRNLPHTFIESSYIRQNPIYIYQGKGTNKFKSQNYLNEHGNSKEFELGSDKGSYRYTTVNLPSHMKTNSNNNRYHHDLYTRPILTEYIPRYSDRHTPVIFYEYNRENVYVPIAENRQVHPREYNGNNWAYLTNYYENQVNSPVNYDYNVLGGYKSLGYRTNIGEEGSQSFHYQHGSHYDKIYGENYRLPAETMSCEREQKRLLVLWTEVQVDEFIEPDSDVEIEHVSESKHNTDTEKKITDNEERNVKEYTIEELTIDEDNAMQ
ncbi:hypothetical protein CBL_01532 [Carabus blaptoides fortunei]